MALLLVACSEPSMEQRLASARQYLERDEPAAAAIEAKNFLAANPDSAVGRYVLGRALLAGGDLDGAATELKRAESLGHEPAELAPTLAGLWLAQQQPRQVLTRFDGLVLPQPRAAAELLTQVAQAQRELGQPDKAQQSVDTALKQWPGFESATILGARLAAERGDLAAALQVGASLLASPGAGADAWLLQADLLALQSDLDPAVAAYRKALELRPRHDQAHISLVVALLRQGDHEATRKQIAAMRKAVPNLPMVDYLDGLARLAARRYRTRARDDRAAQPARVAHRADAAARRHGAGPAGQQRASRSADGGRGGSRRRNGPTRAAHTPRCS